MNLVILIQQGIQMKQLRDTVDYWRSQCGKLYGRLAVKTSELVKAYTEIRRLKKLLKETQGGHGETVSNDPSSSGDKAHT